LWADLDPNVLTEGVESYLKEFRKLTKAVSFSPWRGKLCQLNKVFRPAWIFIKLQDASEQQKQNTFEL